jgi:hypothetical protein
MNGKRQLRMTRRFALPTAGRGPGAPFSGVPLCGTLAIDNAAGAARNAGSNIPFCCSSSRRESSPNTYCAGNGGSRLFRSMCGESSRLSAMHMLKGPVRLSRPRRAKYASSVGSAVVISQRDSAPLRPKWGWAQCAKSRRSALTERNILPQACFWRKESLISPK